MCNIVVVAVLALLLGIAVTQSSQQSELQPQVCMVEELLLDETVFPTPVDAGDIISPLPSAPLNFDFPPWDGQRGSAGRTMYSREGIANHDVIRFRSIAGASREFRRRKASEFRTTEWNGPWAPPTELLYSSAVADQSYTACGLSGYVPMCITLAQYEEYFVYFQAHMAPERWLSFPEYEQALQAIDTKMTACLLATEE